MLKTVFAILASTFMVTTFPALSWGQSANNACGRGSVSSSTVWNDSQAYRRFSYEPTLSAQGGVVTGTTMVPSYRRFSYEPAAVTSARAIPMMNTASAYRSFPYTTSHVNSHSQIPFYLLSKAERNGGHGH